MNPIQADLLDSIIIVAVTFVLVVLILDFPLIWQMIKYYLNPWRYRGKHGMGRGQNSN